MKITVFNLGCKVNQYECDAITEKLTKLGHEVSQNLVYADVYVINTCAVTAEAERKSRQAVSRCRALNPYAKIFVVGCASQNKPGDFHKDGVVYVSGTAYKTVVVDLINSKNFTENVAKIPLIYENYGINEAQRTRAFVKIQDGCNNFCSYCIIPYLRGRSRSRNVDDVVSEIEILSKKTREIVITAIDLTSYGKDNGTSLAELLNRLKDVDVRIRLGSLYAEKLTEEVLDSLFNLKKFCPHFHLSLQSGDDGVLRDMNRHYASKEYLDKIELIRKYDENSAITTDIIVGFPTENDSAFNNTLSFVKQAKFSDLHIFPYSPRNGTKSYALKPLDSEIVKNRKNILQNEKNFLYNEFIEKNIGKMHEVLIEEAKDGYNVGHTRNYVKVYTKRVGEVLNVIPTQKYRDGIKEI